MSQLENSLHIGLTVLFFIGLSVVISCDEEVRSLIPTDKLVMIMRDAHIAETAVLHLKKNEKDSVLNEYYDQICQIHEVQRADLDSSIAMLKREPALASPLYEQVLEELEKLNLEQE